MSLGEAYVFVALVTCVSIVAGGTAAVAGFGIGSILTPLLAWRLGMTTAVAAVAIPHALATALRCWRLRNAIDWRVLKSFGIVSAIGGLVGALLYTRMSNRVLTITLALLLIATAIAGLTSWMRRVHVKGGGASLLGFASGFFGGVAGNQGGLRAAALLAFALSPAAFVATSTATGLLVDAARLPFYLWRAGDEMRMLLPLIAAMSAGVVAGTLLGERILLGLSERRFRQIVSTLIGALGVWLLVQVT